jgi:hypothetical protein
MVFDGSHLSLEILEKTWENILKSTNKSKISNKLLADQNLCFPVFLSYFSRKRCKSGANMFLPNQRDLKLKTPFSGNGVHMKHSAQSPSPQDGPNMPNMVRVQGPRASRTHFFKISIHQMDHQTDLPSCFLSHSWSQTHDLRQRTFPHVLLEYAGMKTWFNRVDW